MMRRLLVSSLWWGWDPLPTLIGSTHPTLPRQAIRRPTARLHKITASVLDLLCLQRLPLVPLLFFPILLHA